MIEALVDLIDENLCPCTCECVGETYILESNRFVLSIVCKYDRIEIRDIQSFKAGSGRSIVEILREFAYIHGIHVIEAVGVLGTAETFWIGANFVKCEERGDVYFSTV